MAVPPQESLAEGIGRPIVSTTGGGRRVSRSAPAPWLRSAIATKRSTNCELRRRVAARGIPRRDQQRAAIVLAVITGASLAAARAHGWLLREYGCAVVPPLPCARSGWLGGKSQIRGTSVVRPSRSATGAGHRS